MREHIICHGGIRSGIYAVRQRRSVCDNAGGCDIQYSVTTLHSRAGIQKMHSILIKADRLVRMSEKNDIGGVFVCLRLDCGKREFYAEIVTVRRKKLVSPVERHNKLFVAETGEVAVSAQVDNILVGECGNKPVDIRLSVSEVEIQRRGRVKPHDIRKDVASSV